MFKDNFIVKRVEGGQDYLNIIKHNLINLNAITDIILYRVQRRDKFCVPIPNCWNKQWLTMMMMIVERRQLFKLSKYVLTSVFVSWLIQIFNFLFKDASVYK